MQNYTESMLVPPSNLCDPTALVASLYEKFPTIFTCYCKKHQCSNTNSFQILYISNHQVSESKAEKPILLTLCTLGFFSKKDVLPVAQVCLKAGDGHADRILAFKLESRGVKSPSVLKASPWKIIYTDIPLIIEVKDKG